MVEKFTDNTINSTNASVVFKQDIKKQLTTLGLVKGTVLLLQVCYHKLERIVGEQQALLEAFMETVGYEGTIVIPTFTPQILDPANAYTKVDRIFWKDIRKSALNFDPKLTMPQNQDALVFQFLKNEGVVRSYHPVYSFAAWGKYAKFICDRHPLHFGLNEDSPLGKVIDFKGKVILLGIDIEESVMMLLAQYKKSQLPICIHCAPILVNQRVEWKDMLDVKYDMHQLKNDVKSLVNNNLIQTFYIGNTRCYLYDVAEIIDFLYNN